MINEEREVAGEPSRLELLYELEQLWTYLENPELTEALFEAEHLRRRRERWRLKLAKGTGGDPNEC